MKLASSAPGLTLAAGFRYDMSVEETADAKPATRPALLHRTVGYVKRHRLVLSALVVLLAVLLVAPTLYAKFSTRTERYTYSPAAVQTIPARPVAIVFGAGILPDNTPTPYLKWRVETAVALYKAHKVKKLLMTGDNSSNNHNEPAVMQKLAESNGVKPSDIVLDYAGLNTYDSCYRAHAIFKVGSAILVSQGYHLPRALMTCNGLGVQSIGMSAEHDGRDFTVTYIAREYVSTDKAVFQLIARPKPTALGPAEPIRL